MVLARVSLKLQTQALKLGFSQMFISRPQVPAGFDRRYGRWLKSKHYGQMTYLVRQAKAKVDPSFAGKYSRIILLTASYFRPKIKFADIDISLYGQSRDYHLVINQKLKKIIKTLKLEYPNYNYRSGVDWGPISEKAVSLQAGLGFLANNNLLINSQNGSFFFIAYILTDLPLPLSRTKPRPLRPQCLKCNRCQSSCPTGALTASGFRADKCLAYLTIEHKGPIPIRYRSLLANHLLGCDICQEVCPYNRSLNLTHMPEFYQTSAFLTGLNLRRILLIKEKKMFWHIFKGTVFSRAGWENIIRNAIYIAGNQKRQDLLEILAYWRRKGTPTIRDASSWAIKRITG